MTICEKSKTDQAAYSIYGTNLLFVDLYIIQDPYTMYKDLRIMIDSGLKFHAHTNAVISRAGAIINNLLRSTVCHSVQLMLTLYLSHIRPIIEYGSCVWMLVISKISKRRIDRL